VQVRHGFSADDPISLSLLVLYSTYSFAVIACFQSFVGPDDSIRLSVKLVAVLHQSHRTTEVRTF